MDNSVPNIQTSGNTSSHDEIMHSSNSERSTRNVQGCYCGVASTKTKYLFEILSEVDRSEPVKLQCLVIMSPFTYVENTILDLMGFGKIHEVEVQVRHIIKLYDLKENRAHHIAVGSSSHVIQHLLSETNYSVQRVVFYWRTDEFEVIDYKHELNQMRMIHDLLRTRKTKVKYDFFSEGKIPKERVEELQEVLWEPKIVQFENKIRLGTLEGIKKHMFVKVHFEDCTELKVDKIVEIIDGIPSTKHTRIVVMCISDMLDILTRKLGEHGHQCALVMTETTTHTELEASRVLLTTIDMQRGMCDPYFDSKVDFIINYSVTYKNEYMDSVGWYRDVDTAITLADQSQFDMLLSLQDTKGVVFEKMVPNKFTSIKNGASETNSTNSKQVIHYSVNLREEDIKTAEIGCFYKRMIAGGGACVIFVKSYTLVSDLVDEIKKVFVDKPDIVVTSSILEVRKLQKDGCPYVFVTADDTTLEDDYGVNQVNKIKKNVHLVISYDKPLKEDAYGYRFGWCHNGAIFHFLTNSDCLDIFDMQIRHSFIIRGLTYYRYVDAHLEKVMKQKKIVRGRKKECRKKRC